jgi:hypothetical protein
LKRNGGVDDFETKTRLLLGLKVAGELVLGGWVRRALRGARRTSASQMGCKNNWGKLKDYSSHNAEQIDEQS